MATGFRIAFLVLAVEFFSMLAASFAVARLSWPRESFDFLGQAIACGAGALLLVAVGPLRRFCTGELARALPRGAGRELVLVPAAKVAIPFAVIGAMVLWAFSIGEPGRLAFDLNHVDPVKARDWALSPLGLIRMLVFSWVVGPIIEELVFRGFIYRAWERQWGWIPSLLLTSALFSICHPNFIASSFLGSVVYICVLRRTGTLRASILVHAAFNVLVSWPLMGQVILTPPVADPARLSSWAISVACLAFVVVALPAYLWMSRTDVRNADGR
ncbi:MAG: CPBP family intramembrane metalloprotease [Betaproteobacteria bacterium]|nr:CPBP family intramembrane metalloprotease [Betaproteobacteria bacterium]